MVVSDIVVGVVYGKGRMDDVWEVYVSGNCQCFFYSVCDIGMCGVEINFFYCDIEVMMVFGFINGVGGGVNYGDVEFFQYVLLFQFQCVVQCGLVVYGWQYCIWMFFFNDFVYYFLVNWFDVGGIGYFWVGYDGGWVGVYQNDVIVFFVQGFICLSVGVVKFICLIDNNWVCVQNQDVFYICMFWYGFYYF